MSITPPAPGRAEGISDEQLDALEEMAATVAVKGPLLRELIAEVRANRRPAPAIAIAPIAPESLRDADWILAMGEATKRLGSDAKIPIVPEPGVVENWLRNVAMKMPAPAIVAEVAWPEPPEKDDDEHVWLVYQTDRADAALRTLAEVTEERDVLGERFAQMSGAYEDATQRAEKAERERDAIVSAVRWVLNDAAYKAPEQIPGLLRPWFAHLAGALPDAAALPAPATNATGSSHNEESVL